MHPDGTRHSYPTGQLGAPLETPSAQFRPPKRRSHAGLIAAVVVGVLALLGVGVYAGLSLRGSPTAAPSLAAEATSAAPKVQAPQTSAPAPAKSAPKLGQEVAWPDGLKVTAFAWKQPVAKSAPKPSEDGAPAGYVWGALDVQVCVPNQATLSNLPWYVRYADNTTIEPSSTGYSQFPKPEYIWGERNVAAGSCTRGWITFAVPGDVRPVSAVYSVEDKREATWLAS